MPEIVRSTALLLVLLNPFLVIVYLIDMVQKLDEAQFRRVLLRAGMVSCMVFCSFAILGDAIFAMLLQVEFASFQIFGGLVFLLIGLQFVFRGPTAIEMLRGESQHLAGAIAMPVLIGPGSISASVVVGERHEPMIAVAVILAALTICLLTILILKGIHDFARPRWESLVERYIEIAGRVTALIVGTIAAEMIVRGVKAWVEMP